MRRGAYVSGFSFIRFPLTQVFAFRAPPSPYLTSQDFFAPPADRQRKKKRWKSLRGKGDTLLKKGCPPFPAPPSPFLKLLFLGDGRGKKARQGAYRSGVLTLWGFLFSCRSPTTLFSAPQFRAFRQPIRSPNFRLRNFPTRRLPPSSGALPAPLQGSVHPTTPRCSPCAVPHLCASVRALFRFDVFSFADIPAGCPMHPRPVVSPPANGRTSQGSASLPPLFPLLPRLLSPAHFPSAVASSSPASPPLDFRRCSSPAHAGVSSLRFSPSLFLSPLHVSLAALSAPRNFCRPAFPPPGFVPCRSAFSPGTPPVVILS